MDDVKYAHREVVTDFERFHRWLMEERSVVEKTAYSYVGEVRRALENNVDPSRRLAATSLSPKTRRKLLAALRQWARFTRDEELEAKLHKDMPLIRRLPAGERVSMRRPFSKEEWKKFRDALDRAPDKIGCPTAVQAVIGIMANRGMRVGDVLRMSRHQVAQAAQVGRVRFIAKGQKQLEYDMEPCRRFIEILDGERGWNHVWDLIVRHGTDTSQEARAKAAYMTVWRWCRRVGGLAKLDENYTHRLRRTVATAFVLKLQGDPLALIKLQKWMGWSALETAKGYVDYVVQAELDKVGRTLTDD